MYSFSMIFKRQGIIRETSWRCIDDCCWSDGDELTESVILPCNDLNFNDPAYTIDESFMESMNKSPNSKFQINRKIQVLKTLIFCPKEHVKELFE